MTSPGSCCGCRKWLWVSIAMQNLTWTSRAGRAIFRIKSYEKIYSRDHDDGNRARGLLGRAQADLRTTGDQHVNIALDEVGREVGQPINLSLGVPELEDDVVFLHIPEFLQGLRKGHPLGRGAR